MAGFEIVKAKEVHEERRRGESREPRLNTDKGSAGEGTRSVPDAVSSDVREEEAEEEKISPESRAHLDSLTYSATMAPGLDDKAFGTAAGGRQESRNAKPVDVRKDATGSRPGLKETHSVLTNDSVFGVRPEKESEAASSQRYAEAVEEEQTRSARQPIRVEGEQDKRSSSASSFKQEREAIQAQTSSVTAHGRRQGPRESEVLIESSRQSEPRWLG